MIANNNPNMIGTAKLIVYDAVEFVTEYETSGKFVGPSNKTF